MDRTLRIGCSRNLIMYDEMMIGLILLIGGAGISVLLRGKSLHFQCMFADSLFQNAEVVMALMFFSFVMHKLQVYMSSFPQQNVNDLQFTQSKEYADRLRERLLAYSMMSTSSICRFGKL